ncbi:MAG: cyclic nucleotide-binding domain-containing protein [Magnetococcales bacterium]|nr:cyclic nucleotide-binding domain-containing protein [Magnetococcales bacterium]
MSAIRKINIIQGVFWVEIPSIGLYILCGCPADVVKHLMKRGLIVTTEKNGVPFETGPNAILLSDIPIQNGTIANLAEFPVLQMLYRQGTILPNHPNNTGIKPLLIGTETQVKRQMQYIFRGNYGLISEEEMLAAGASIEEAQWNMALKLRFAFGTIHPTEKLLDGLVVGDSAVEIRQGATINRINPNEFQISYQGENVSVDLNLPSNGCYDSPYPLGYHNLHREYFAVVHSGQGDGWDIDNPSMSSILVFQGAIYLVDAGPNLVAILTALGISINEVRGLFHTHAHDDHFAGITTLIRAGHRINYYATPLVLASVSKKLSALLGLDEPFLHHFFEICPLAHDVWNEIDGLHVKPVYSPHPVETSLFFFRVRGPDRIKTYAHWADLTSLDVLRSMIRDDPKKPGISQALFDRVKEEYLAPADLKKIDIGGGMIHGQAEDFVSDQSAKMVFAHTSAKLNAQQRKIGSSATFGAMDVLIPSMQDYSRRFAYHYLANYYAEVPENRLRVLLNTPLIVFNPGTIVIREGEIHKDLYLICTGIVEQIQEGVDLIVTLSAGSIVGDISAMHAMPAIATFRTTCFVQCLSIPGDLYMEFITQNNLYANFERFQDSWSFLRTTWLFGDLVNLVNLTRIALSMNRVQIKSGDPLSLVHPQHLYLVQEGEMMRLSNQGMEELLTPGDFFGEEYVLQIPFTPYTLEVQQSVIICQIPVALLFDIPIVRWKLLEVAERRREQSLP